MTIIAPSLLAADFMNLGEEIKRLEKAHDIWLHLDIMDGHYVPNLTFGAPVLKEISQYTSHKLDAHFMVTNPEDYLDDFAKLNIHNFTFHWEAVTHQDSFIQKAKKVFPSVGISLNPATPIEVIPEYILEKIDLILIMTVNPGFGGQSFIEGCKNKIDKLAQLRSKHSYSFQIQVDGGIKDSNASELIKLGADNLVAGSYIFGSKEKKYVEQIESLRN
ncbi:MAG: ribulose-phosphate 3-epimerase [Halobacteriovoraceae bacterium]|nr:ribulose-phosphate 3-epimerase [Halobacteriovoraceae bacterium]|tara:strand:+ start:10290 stop:10943 length:654 start_codon:yes stop_codon:yes gene_type:complete